MSATREPFADALGALRRAQEVLRDLDHSRQEADLVQAMHAARHEVDTAIGLLDQGNVRPDRARVMRVALVSGQQRHRILTALYHDGPMTDHELQQGLAISPGSERPRRGDLVRAGLIQAVLTEEGLVCSREHDGSKWTLWEVTEDGRAAVQRIGVQQALAV